MAVRLRFLTLFLLAGSLMARGQDLRTGTALPGDRFLAAGECLMWMDSEGKVVRRRPLEQPVAALAAVGNRWYALAADGRELLRLDPNGVVAGREKLPAKGRLRALAANGNTLWVVTDAGEILHREGTSEWTVLDFNEQYAGYYPRMAFRAVAAGGGSVMVAGSRPDGTPAVFTSARGSVWNERTLDYSEQGGSRTFSAVVMGLCYDGVQDRFYLQGSEGMELALPGCSHCNSLTRYPVDTLYARIPGSISSLLLGSDGFRRMESR